MKTRDDLISSLDKSSIAYNLLDGPAEFWAVIAPSMGARILGTGVDEENFFWVPSDGPVPGEWNCGGQRTWIAPELGSRGFFGTGFDDWKVPPPIDPGNYSLTGSSDHSLSFRNEFSPIRIDGSEYNAAIRRSIEIEGNSTAHLSVTTGLENLGEKVIEEDIGLWNIIQAPSEVPALFIIPVKTAGPVLRHYFGELPPEWVRYGSGAVYVRACAGKVYKAGIPAKYSAGSIAYIRPSRTDRDRYTMIIKTFPVDPEGTYKDKPPASTGPEGDVLQIYNSPDSAALPFSELECHAPAVRLEPGESQNSTFSIKLYKGSLEEINAAAEKVLSIEINADTLFYRSP
jgi:hypothetical protein